MAERRITRRAAGQVMASGLALAAAACAPSTSGGGGAATRPEDGDAAARVLDALRPTATTAEIDQAVELAGSSGDPRLIAVLIEVVRAHEIGLLPDGSPGIVHRELSRLAGQPEQTWQDWVRWYAATDLAPPPGFRSWKGRVYGRLDENFPAFFREDAPSRIRVEEVVWGGVRLDGIPALDNPSTLAAEDAVYLTGPDLVFGVHVNGEARAYPLRIMDWHEMANDVVGGVPVSLAYCTLCGAGVLFDGRVGDAAYTFGSSGFLMRSNKLMYDRTTHTLWNQLTGEPVLGELAAQPIELARLPVVVTTWHTWRTRHPATRVLSLDTGHVRVYASGAPYGGYFASPDTMFPAVRSQERLPDKARVFALHLHGQARAYATSDLAAQPVVNDQIGDTPVVVIASGSNLRGVGVDGRRGLAQWDAGMEVRAYERGPQRFQAAADSSIVRDAQARPWQITEQALVGPDGTTLPRVPGHLAYWFGWISFYPRGSLYTPTNAAASA